MLMAKGPPNTIRRWSSYTWYRRENMAQRISPKMKASNEASSRPAMLLRVVPRGLVTHAATTVNVSSQPATVVGPTVFWQVYDRLGVSASFGICAAVEPQGSLKADPSGFLYAIGNPGGLLLRQGLGIRKYIY